MFLMDYILMSLRLETRAGFGDCVSRRTCLFTLCNFLWYKTCLFCVTCRQTYDQFENNQKIIRCFCRPTLSSTSVDKHRRLLDPNVSSVLSRLYQQLLVNVPQWQQSHGNIWILNAPLRSLQHTKENLLWPAVGLLQKQLSSDYCECKEVVLVVMTVLWAWYKYDCKYQPLSSSASPAACVPSVCRHVTFFTSWYQKPPESEDRQVQPTV